MTTLRTFQLPAEVSGSIWDIALGVEMIRTWQSDGIFQVATGTVANAVTAAALRESRRFFAQPLEAKTPLVSDLTYAGYVASGEEVTAGERDYSEIFTVCKDVPLGDPRVRAGWPCHGPVPWPGPVYRDVMTALMSQFGLVGDKVLKLAALGLGLSDMAALTSLATDGWHHMRVLRFPARSAATARGIGAHTDYGMLVIATQDDVGNGLYVRPPVIGEKRPRNWLDHESSAGAFEREAPWNLVSPVPSTFTVFPGDILQFLTNGALLSTPHKVKLAERERYSIAYFHEPDFAASLRPLTGGLPDEVIHYGTHFTSMFMRCYPDRLTTRRILAEDRLQVLDSMRESTLTA
ncbi:2-oxoglutarate and iron-dependent oxygenase domain-containing protein [Kutzneria buriramensis]|uniref:Isopenicillin N synthase-like dioxygenase n=1 Tax=Kutzneria buriramensis TaxID=1045776 RepID=A0A3E0I632_9PSEU|nr:2-oxoglutarate and iron-dependent oxygenase domain-containing protein [Kutzneria buriramensis]REH54208.1 isopenicillin N synthase-like dioxygenase [Kutzneria buriramensis]